MKEDIEKAESELREFLTTHPDQVDLDIQQIATMYDRYKTMLAQLRYEKTNLEYEMESLKRKVRTGLQGTINPLTGKIHARDLSEDMAYIDPQVEALRNSISELEYDVEVFQGHCEAINMKSSYLSGFQGRINRQMSMDK